MSPYTESIERWYAIRVRSNCEKVVSLTLSGKGYATFLPSYRKLSRWSDRNKQIELPLFPGYVFSSFDINRRLPVLMTPGILSIIGVGSTPEPVQEEELSAIRRFIASGSPVEPWPFVKVGDAVVVDCGPMAGLEGILAQVKNRYRLVVSLTLLQRSIAVEIDRDCIRPVATSGKRLLVQAPKAMAANG